MKLDAGRLPPATVLEVQREKALKTDLSLSAADLAALATQSKRSSFDFLEYLARKPADAKDRSLAVILQAGRASAALAGNLFETQGLDPDFAQQLDAFSPPGQVNQAASNPSRAAELLQQLATARQGSGEHRVEQTRQLMASLTPEQAGKVIDAYVAQFGRHPEFDLRSDGLGQPLEQLSEAEEIAMIHALNHAQLKADAQRLVAIAAKDAASLTQVDRQDFYRTLPMLGLWDRSVRQAVGGPDLDSSERKAFLLAWQEVTGASDPGQHFDDTVKTARAKLANVAPAALEAPREKSIALVASPHGAQWQEAMDFALTMRRAGYAVQTFTPDDPSMPGAVMPVGFQRDSLCVSRQTTELGLGAPDRLNPRDPEVARLTGELLGNVRKASDFDRAKFGLVFLAGGLGFNEDVIRAERMPSADIAKLPPNEKVVYLAHLTDPVTLTLDPSIKKLMLDAVGTGEQQPLNFVTLCHGATAFAGLDVEVKRGGQSSVQRFIRGVKTASLPPFEAGVRLRGAVGKPFLDSPVLDTHAELARAGAAVDPLNTAVENATAMSKVTASTRFLEEDAQGNPLPNGRRFEVISGPGPQTAENLAKYVLAQGPGFMRSVDER